MSPVSPGGWLKPGRLFSYRFRGWQTQDRFQRFPRLVSAPFLSALFLPGLSSREGKVGGGVLGAREGGRGTLSFFYKATNSTGSRPHPHALFNLNYL